MKRMVLAAAALVCLTNIGALGLGAVNRTIATSEAVLTERELRLGSAEHSLTLLRIVWRQPSPTYFGVDGIRRVGFTPVDPAHAGRQLARQAYVALEYDGPAWRAYRDSTLLREPTPVAPLTPEQAVFQARMRQQAADGTSRLFAVDIDRNAAALRARHPDTAHYLIAPARVALTRQYGEHGPTVAASVTELVPSEINVPRPFSVVLRESVNMHASGYGDPLPSPPRYAVRLRYGRFYEPWIAELTPLK